MLVGHMRVVIRIPSQGPVPGEALAVISMRIILESGSVVVYHEDSMHESPPYVEEEWVSTLAVHESHVVGYITVVHQVVL